MNEDAVAYTYNEEFVGVPVPPDGSRYQVIHEEWLLNESPPRRRIFEYRLIDSADQDH